MKIKNLLQFTILFFIAITSFAQNTSQITQIKIFHPFVKQAINPSLKISNKISGYCWVPSLRTQRPNAWRCMAGNVIHDPCFVNAAINSKSAVCIDEPWQTSVTLMQLTKPLPKTKPMTFNPQQAQAWFVELSNGARCQFLTGATGIVNGQRLNYGCDQNNFYIIGDLDKTSHTWYANYYNLKNQSSEKIAVTSVWY